MRNEKFGKKWWASLSKTEKEDAVRPHVRAGLSNGEILSLLGLRSLNQVSAVRHRLNLQRPDYVPSEKERRQKPLSRQERIAREAHHRDNTGTTRSNATHALRRVEAFPQPNDDLSAEDIRTLEKMYHD